MLEKLESLSPFVKDSPLLPLYSEKAELFTKLEYNNFSGSIKDRAGYSMLVEAYKKKIIGIESHIVESSSGNLAISLAKLCKYCGMKFTAIIDSNINVAYQKVLNMLCHQVVMINTLDETGGYLLNRLKKVKEITENNPEYYWTNQYNNSDNYLGYSQTLAEEVILHFNRLDYVFVAVSSGGAITGLSARLKEKYPSLKVVAVDIEGSVVFNDQPRRRYISGLGSSIKSNFIQNAEIDHVVHVSHHNIIKGCKQYFAENSVFAGASTGAVYYAINDFLDKEPSSKIKPVVLFFTADSGYPYMDTVYNENWKEFKNNLEVEKI